MALKRAAGMLPPNGFTKNASKFTFVNMQIELGE
mgnify:CR=1 FL=1